MTEPDHADVANLVQSWPGSRGRCHAERDPRAADASTP